MTGRPIHRRPGTGGDTSRFRVVVLGSGDGAPVQALLDHRDGFVVGAVISDRQPSDGLDRARAAGVPTAVVRPGDFPDPATWHGALLRAVDAFRPGLLVLADFAPAVGEPLLAAYAGRIVATGAVEHVDARGPGTAGGPAPIEVTGSEALLDVVRRRSVAAHRPAPPPA